MAENSLNDDNHHVIIVTNEINLGSVRLKEVIVAQNHILNDYNNFGNDSPPHRVSRLSFITAQCPRRY